MNIQIVRPDDRVCILKPEIYPGSSPRKVKSEPGVLDDMARLTEMVNLDPLIFGKPREVRFCFSSSLRPQPQL